jgi:small subunit ribosomal protein S4
MKIKAGDIIEVKDNKKSSPVFAKNKEEMEKYDVPSWLKVDTKKLSIEVLDLPGSEHFENLIEPRLVIEFYSR